MLGDSIRVALGMTYGGPSIDGAIRALAEQNAKRLLVLPLFPQYCSSTTGSVFDRTVSALKRLRWLPEIRFVNDYYADPGYAEDQHKLPMDGPERPFFAAKPFRPVDFLGMVRTILERKAGGADKAAKASLC